MYQRIVGMTYMLGEEDSQANNLLGCLVWSSIYDSFLDLICLHVGEEDSQANNLFGCLVWSSIYDSFLDSLHSSLWSTQWRNKCLSRCLRLHVCGLSSPMDFSIPLLHVTHMCVMCHLGKKPSLTQKYLPVLVNAQ